RPLLMSRGRVLEGHLLGGRGRIARAPLGGAAGAGRGRRRAPARRGDDARRILLARRALVCGCALSWIALLVTWMAPRARPQERGVRVGRTHSHTGVQQ